MRGAHATSRKPQAKPGQSKAGGRSGSGDLPDVNAWLQRRKRWRIAAILCGVVLLVGAGVWDRQVGWLPSQQTRVFLEGRSARLVAAAEPGAVWVALLEDESATVGREEPAAPAWVKLRLPGVAKASDPSVNAAAWQAWVDSVRAHGDVGRLHVPGWVVKIDAKAEPLRAPAWRALADAGNGGPASLGSASLEPASLEPATAGALPVWEGVDWVCGQTPRGQGPTGTMADAGVASGQVLQATDKASEPSEAGGRWTGAASDTVQANAWSLSEWAVWSGAIQPADGLPAEAARRYRLLALDAQRAGRKPAAGAQD